MIKLKQPKYNDIDIFLSFVWNSSLPFEEWREIEGTDGKTFVSSEGRILSLRQGKAKILKKYNCGNGYSYVDIRYNDDDTFKNTRVCRLVAKAFIDNPDNKKYVHHKNHNKKDDRAINL